MRLRQLATLKGFAIVSLVAAIALAVVDFVIALVVVAALVVLVVVLVVCAMWRSLDPHPFPAPWRCESPPRKLDEGFSLLEFS